MARSPYGNRYDARIMNRARELRAGGWQLDRIRDLLQKEFGVRPARATLHTWVDDKQREKNNARSRRGHRERTTMKLPGRIGSIHHTVEFQQRRAQVLLERGITQINVARIMDFDYPDQRWTYKRVRTMVAEEVAA